MGKAVTHFLRKREVVTEHRLRSLLLFDPETGIFRWRVSRRGVTAGTVAGRKDKRGYVRIYIDGQGYPAQRLAWLYMHGEWPSDEIDHRNRRNGVNSKGEIREATRSQNMQNSTMHRDNMTGFKGVTRQRERYRAQITIDGKNQYLGLFATAEDAHAVYCEAARIAFGEFARFS